MRRLIFANLPALGMERLALFYEAVIGWRIAKRAVAPEFAYYLVGRSDAPKLVASWS